HVPQEKPQHRPRRPRVEEVPEDREQTNAQPESHWEAPESSFSGDEVGWQLTESELDGWFKVEREWRRAEAIKLQKELERRQKERREAWENEEAQRERDWKEWLKRQRAEPGLRKWFFWRNRLKEPATPKKLSGDSLGGSSAPPSREVPMENESMSQTRIDHVAVDALAQLSGCSNTERTSEDSGGRPGVTGGDLEGEEFDTLPQGRREDLVGGWTVPPSRGVSTDKPLIDPQIADRENVVPIQNPWVPTSSLTR
ncbi:hypothetical protein GG344DRAFT_71074, partial [Lentinula edodes]